jgi:transcriptional regulator with XRE-family HTH domain
MKNKQTTDVEAPKLYRHKLLQQAKYDRYGLGLRDIARYTHLSVNSVSDALDGKATKIETLWKLCRFFEIPWIALFDLDRKLTVERKKNPKYEPDVFLSGKYTTGYEITAGLAELATPDPASKVRKVAK